jgi:peptide/nickel transport system permease protein
VFLAAQVLPGDVGRRVLGPFADQASVDALNKQLGTDRSLMTQYWDWISHFVTGDLGESIRNRPVSDVLFDPMVSSGKLALLAFVIVVPLAIAGGVIAAMNEGSFRDRLISVGGLSATAIPEFVWAVFFILIFALGLGLFPTTAQFPEGSSVFTQLKYLLLPSLCLVCVLFGYIARMARAGTIEALDADYTRTAILKGLPQRTVIRRHVLRNSLLPTIAVVATQAGYLIGGLVIIEVIFNYNGIGYLVATLIADILYSVLNPRVRLGAAE